MWLERPNRFMLYWAIFCTYVIILISLYLKFKPSVTPLEVSQQILIYLRVLSSIPIVFWMILLFENLLKNHRETEPVFSVIWKNKKAHLPSKLNFIIENYGKSYIKIKEVCYYVKEEEKDLRDSNIKDSGYIDFLKKQYAEILIWPWEKLEFSVVDYFNENENKLPKDATGISHISVICSWPSNTQRKVINPLNGKQYITQLN